MKSWPARENPARLQRHGGVVKALCRDWDYRVVHQGREPHHPPDGHAASRGQREPDRARGGGAFTGPCRRAKWYEIGKGKGFLKAAGRWDWAVGNPPFSRFRDFLRKAMEVADNVVFIAPAPRVVRQSPPGGHGGGTVRPGGAVRLAHPAGLAPIRHRADRRLGAPGLARRHRPHPAT